LDRAASTRRRRLAVAGVILASTIASMWLRARGYPWLIADMVYDDGYFARSAGNILDGNWLGPHDMVTLSKGPTYPLFIAGAYQLHLPLKLAEHALHLLAGATVAWAAWRVTRLRVVALAAYVAVALNPAYLGSAASRVSREVVYGALSLMLVAGLIVFLTYVPSLVAAGPRRAFPAGLVGGAALGVVTAAYYLCREERSWLAPALLVGALAGMASWGRIGRAWIPKALLAGGALVIAAAVLAGSLQWVSSQNEERYGAPVITDLVEGEVAHAYAQWQRVDVGEPRRFVVVTRSQRLAVYDVSPAAAELRRTLERGRATHMWGAGCLLADVCDDYTGAQFVWALRLSAAMAGHMDSADETYRFFGRIADDIEAACGVEFPCTAPGIASMPPLARAPLRAIPSSLRDAGWFLARFDAADPNRVLTGFGPSPYTPSGGTSEQWDTMTGPLRGVVEDQRTFRADERDAMKDQELVRVLWFVYRWGALPAALLGVAGLVGALVTGAWRRHLGLVLTTATLLAAVLTRLAVFALIDATAYPAAGNGTYVIPGVDFYVVFGVLGTWLLATVASEARRPAPPAAAEPVAPAAPTPAVAESPAPPSTVLVP
jgi:hypothetical protein